jgi:predicted kinase
MKGILLVLGGFTGVGKSTLAYGLVRTVPALRAARVMECDVTHREMLGYDLAYTMTDKDYVPEVMEIVYARHDALLREALSAGLSVIEASGCWSQERRDEMEAIAREGEVAFRAFWLTAPWEVMGVRIDQRLSERVSGEILSAEKGHASDACRGVLERCKTFSPPSSPLWPHIDASKGADEVLAEISVFIV